MHDKQTSNQEIEGATPVEQTRPTRRYTPVVDIYENSEELVLLADLPGVEEHGLQIEVSQGILTLEAKVTDEQNPAEKSYYRQFKLSEQVDLDGGEALLKDGVLTLKLPKVAEAKPKKIVVRTLH